MGLLDEAIKQHLELKRLRGADPGEIARQEHEALDPPGVEPIGGLVVTAAGEDHAGVEQAPAVAADGATVAEPPPADPVAALPAPGEAPPPLVPAAYEPPPEAPAPPPTHDDSPELPAEPHHEAQPVAEQVSGEAFGMEPAAPVDAATLHQPTAEYALEDLEALRAEPETEPEPEPAAPTPAPADDAPAPDGDDEDVLEETPEFLQETPEHDRLWFEQKPPRDFDF